MELIYLFFFGEGHVGVTDGGRGPASGEDTSRLGRSLSTNGGRTNCDASNYWSRRNRSKVLGGGGGWYCNDDKDMVCSVVDVRPACGCLVCPSNGKSIPDNNLLHLEPRD
jgi:hypothetical protein